ncbi:unnamed protein product [Moneuplotes crassus]|uniref:U-box domain-containing protein n=1 Tax=Euplotes crassus TaxID=5936 RepID=A0AAD2D3T3_EUPCR|nr:unnamed protein product [Moneuplotes crassus]
MVPNPEPDWDDWMWEDCSRNYIRVNKGEPNPYVEINRRKREENKTEKEKRNEEKEKNEDQQIKQLEEELAKTKTVIDKNYDMYDKLFKEDEIESLKAQKQQLIDEYTNFVKHEIPHTKERIKQTYSPFNIQQISKSGDRIITEIKELIESPISLEHFIDPFQAPSGHTFDQTDSDSIMRSGVDPITRVPLSPNHIRPHFICKHITDLIRHHTD